jgi:hypothetical protein
MHTQACALIPGMAPRSGDANEMGVQTESVKAPVELPANTAKTS